MRTLPLDENSYPLYAVKSWKSDFALDVTEFNKDAKLFKNVKRNICKYYNNHNIKLNLIINQLIILQNQFEPISVSRILFYLIDKEQHSILVALLITIGIFDSERIPEADKDLIVDKRTIEELEIIYHNSK